MNSSFLMATRKGACKGARTWHVLAMLGTALSLLVYPATAFAQHDPATLERRVKAAFIYKFVGYVTWPDGTFSRPDTPVMIGVLGDELLATELAEVVATRTVDGRPIAVRRLTDTLSLTGLHMLFVGRAEAAQLPALARASSAHPLLILSETEGSLNQGGMINFVVSEGRVKFDIALDATEKRGIRLSARLLTVARSVRPAPAS